MSAPDYLPPHLQRDWNEGEFGPVSRCASCWKDHPAYWDCQLHPILAARAPATDQEVDDE